MSVNELSEYIRVSKYAQYNEEKGRRETWDEQLDRVMGMHQEKYAYCLPDIQEELAFAEEFMRKKKVLGSQRALQFGGYPILSKEARIYNCFSEDTDFITSTGVKSFKDFSDGDEINVITHTGKWKNAVVKNYGEGSLNKVTFNKGGSKNSEIHTTSDHTWLLKDGSRTNKLSVGNQLVRQPNIFNDWEYETAPPEERLYWAYGLVYGDGTRIKNKDGVYKHSMIRLCGFDKQYRSRFEELGFKTSSSQSLEGDFMAYTGTYLKTLPNPEVDDIRLIRAFVRGFLDADGAKNKKGASIGNGSKFVSIQQSSPEAQEFIRTIFPIVGVYVISERIIDHETNFGKHNAISFRVSTSAEGTAPLWKVNDIRPADVEELWCLEVEDDHSFVMPNGVVTGNCSASYIDRVAFFQEAFWLALCGCGVGMSVQKHHIAQLPKINVRDKGEKIYIVDDSIEGWADALGVLLSSFFITKDVTFSEYQGYIVKMDFSNIRPEGAPIKSSGAKAPGPKGLIASLTTINNLLTSKLEGRSYYKLQPVDAYDIVCHTFDAVLSGGVRRSSAICLFSKDDEEMLNAKTGNWLAENPQRARANNSVVLLRNETTSEEFDEIMLSVKEFGEPGFIWADNTEMLLNPCQNETALFLTKGRGIQQLKDIEINDIIWTGKQWSPMINKWSTGIKPVYRYTTSNGYYTECTENHRVVQNGTKIEIKDAECIDKAVGIPTFGGNTTDDAQAILAGLVLGDGSKQKNGGKCAYLNIGEKDGDHYSYVKQYIAKIIEKNEHKHTLWKLTKDFDSLNLVYAPTPERIISAFWMESSASTMCYFLKGLYSANGSIIDSAQRITYKGTSKKLIQQIQIMLSALGMRSYITTNKPSEIQWNNGLYISKESYDLNITSDINLFKELIGFTQKYKMDKIKDKKKTNPQTSTSIVDIKYLGDMEVFDYTVEAEEHTVWQGGLHLSNCAEVGLLAKHQVTGESGWQVCNLSEGNMSKVKTPEDFYDVCKAASIIGTLQAGYTDLAYLGQVSKEIIEGEALIGVSMTGIMDSPDIALNPAVLKKGAEIVKATNKALAKKLGINPAARSTLVKPSGTASAMLGTASGIHPHHANRYFRLVQANKHEETLSFFRKHNPFAIEQSVWDTNKLTDVITFCCEVPSGAKTKNQINAIDFLEKVKLVQTNWVMEGKDVDLCAAPWLSHNVSNTIHVMPHEWDDVTDYIFENREYFTGISLIPQSGDKDYPQSPFTAVYTPNEIVKMYGDASIFASGLVVHGIKAFDENVWEACNAILGYGKPLEMPDTTTASIGEIQKMAQSILDKEFWIKRAKKFADRYFDGDIKKMTYCLKDVYNWKRWVDLKRDYVKVPWTEFYEDDNNTKFEQSIACSGGSCELL